MWKNRNGFSLIEAVIVIALIGVLVGSSVSMIGYLRYANTKKVVEKVNSELNSLRLETMSQTGDKYLYIYYKENDGYYMNVLETKHWPEAGGTLPGDITTGGMKLCGESVEFYTDEAESDKVTGGHYICVAYTKSGLFKGGYTPLIKIVGSRTYTIHLDGVSGRHYVD